jgi:hypothetical protein
MSGWQGEQCIWMQTRPGDPQTTTSSWDATGMGLQRAALACGMLAVQARRFKAKQSLSSHSIPQHADPAHDLILQWCLLCAAVVAGWYGCCRLVHCWCFPSVGWL